ncbi:hypothetical protein RJ641_004766 [Dillenia turbinata]|uniref:Serine protease n=1 Tax=Dillenia turbinata TaxID=194707 RepID=A0AAN8VNQ5_9MAGN
MEFGDLPALQDAVTIVGYPIGGDTIFVIGGVVSRMEILFDVHDSMQQFGIQINTTINSGNSGGPTFNDKGKCVGIALQTFEHEDVENIEVIKTFGGLSLNKPHTTVSALDEGPTRVQSSKETVDHIERVEPKEH